MSRPKTIIPGPFGELAVGDEVAIRVGSGPMHIGTVVKADARSFTVGSAKFSREFGTQVNHTDAWTRQKAVPVTDAIRNEIDEGHERHRLLNVVTAVRWAGQDTETLRRVAAALEG